MSQHLGVIDYIIVFAYLVLVVVFGSSFAKRQKNTKEYYKGSGNIPAWAIGMSILATLISSVTFLAYPGAGYASNWILLVQGLMVPIVLVLMVKFIVPLFRDVIGLSAYEYFEKRFGFFARLYTSLAFVLMHFSKMGTVFFLLALALAKMMGLNTFAVIWVLGIGVVFYTLLGGIDAVIWLDVIQGFMLIAGGLLSLGILLFTPPGGVSAVLHTAAQNGKMGFGPYDLDFTRLTFIVMAINGIFYAIQKYGTDQTIVQRYLVAKSDKDAEKAALMGVLLSVPVWALFMFIGTALFSFYQLNHITLPANMRPDAVFPYFIVNQLPAGVTGLILAALVAAALSSLDSDLNCLSAIGVKDYYMRFKPDSTDRDRLKMGRLIVALSGIAALIVASLYVKAGSKGVLGIIFTLYAIFSGGIAGLFLLGIFVPRANKKGVYFGIAAAVLFTAWGLLTSTPIGSGAEKKLLLDLGPFNFHQHKYMMGVYSHIVLFVVGYLASLFFPKEDVSENLTIYGWLKKRIADRAERAQ